MTNLRNYKCQRCGHNECEVGEIHATIPRPRAGIWTKTVPFQGSHFSTVTCNRCKRTELFKVDRGSLASIFDLFASQK